MHEGRRSSSSPFSPNSSPLLHKTLTQRRDSYGSPSPLKGRMGEPGTPSPGGGKASVGLNSKWLYEKGRMPQGANGTTLFSKRD